MQQKCTVTNSTKLDSYSILICSKFFKTPQDFINIICVNSKFKETTEKLRFNPIPIKSLKLFPKIQTQYLYSDQDTKINGIYNYETWYKVEYETYLKYKKDTIDFHNIVYTKYNRKIYGYKILDSVTELGDSVFEGCTSLKSIDLPFKLKILNTGCFANCIQLTSINIPSTIVSLGNYCFHGCSSLNSITLPSLIQSLGNRCFSNCRSLTSITLPFYLTLLGDHCFENCSKLISINLPSTLNRLGNKCFNNCLNLKLVNGTGRVVIGKDCFNGCNKLKHSKNNTNYINF